MILLYQSVFRLHENPHQILSAQSVQRGDHRQTAHQLGNQAVFQNVMGLNPGQNPAQVPLLLPLNLRAEADALLVQPLLDDLIQPVERAAADKQDVLGVHLNELLMRMLPPALGGDVGHGALHDFQQSLLHAFAGDIPRDGDIFALAGNFVNLIHIDNAPLGPLHIKVGGL
ncbi:hypothetical protein SDC9_93890 [bioreactor metagenome]|uniref:Uncharacterized protein n=1 Tax=bioreactor metagenome TaxID=1076179 RepID=A0A645A2C8_9ZZZZ